MSESLFSGIPGGASITEISVVTRDPNLRRVRVGGRTVATLRTVDVDALGLGIGKRWTDALASRIGAAVAANRARAAAMGILGRRALARNELIDRLCRKGHDRTLAQRIARELAESGWLDDAAYGEAVLRGTIRRGPASARLLQAKLEARKVEPALAARLARKAASTMGLPESAVELAREHLASIEHLPRIARTRRVCGLLTRRGFDEETINFALARLGLDVDDQID